MSKNNSCQQSWDPIWEEVFISQKWGKYPGEDTIRFIARNFFGRERKETRIMEVGCGTGANQWFLAREGFDSFGVDGSPTAVCLCNSLLQSDGISASLTVGDILSLPYADNFFDGVLDIECLCCNSRENTKKILQEICRTMKPGGKFYSRSFTDKLYIGKEFTRYSKYEYNDISRGPLANKGFVRLMDRSEIHALYGEIFKIESIDHSEHTLDNGNMTIPEWQIVCTKKSLH